MAGAIQYRLTRNRPRISNTAAAAPTSNFIFSFGLSRVKLPEGSACSWRESSIAWGSSTAPPPNVPTLTLTLVRGGASVVVRNFGEADGGAVIHATMRNDSKRRNSLK